MRGLDQISKKFPEAYQVANTIYALVCPILEKYEAGGSNGHHRTQVICQEVVEEMEKWILNQKIERAE